jgi:hypothetical protein
VQAVAQAMYLVGVPADVQYPVQDLEVGDSAQQGSHAVAHLVCRQCLGPPFEDEPDRVRCGDRRSADADHVAFAGLDGSLHGIAGAESR